jgi:G3E family GTPase
MRAGAPMSEPMSEPTPDPTPGTDAPVGESAARRPPLPTLLLTGFLGAGKTTLLSGWLAARPAGERWAVLVNEFGALGVDRALLGGEAGGPDAPVAIAEVAGGCACCAARVAFGATLTRLLRRGPWDRLLIETTGLGHPGELVDQLRGPAFAARLRVLPPVAVVDATRAALYTDPSRPGHLTALDQVTLARLLVLNRAGAVAPQAADALAARLGDAPPWSRPVLRTATGAVPLAEVLAALAADGPAGDLQERAAVAPTRAVAPPASAHPFGQMADPRLPGAPGAQVPAAAPAELPRALHWDRQQAGTAACGWWWPGSATFDRACLLAALEALAAPGGALQACGLLRGKGVFRTPRAWYAWQWVDGASDWRETAWRADSRFELLAQRPIDPDMVDSAVRAAAWKG